MTLRWIPLLFVAAAILPGQTHATLTANQIIERIRAHVGVPWQKKTVDTFKAGDPQTPVTGVAVTMMATYDVLVRAATTMRVPPPT